MNINKDELVKENGFVKPIQNLDLGPAKEYIYFCTKFDEDNIPSKSQIESNNNNPNSKEEQIPKTLNFISPIDLSSLDLKIFDYNHPISILKSSNYDPTKIDKNHPIEVIKLTLTKVQLPSDYFEFNKTSPNTDTIQPPTLLKEISPPDSENKENEPDELSQCNKIINPPEPDDDTKEKSHFQRFKSKMKEKNEETAEKTPKNDSKQFRQTVDSRILHKECRKKHNKQPEIVQIPSVSNKKIKNEAPTCSRHPEIYTREFRQSQKKLNDDSNQTEEVKEREEEEKVSLPDNTKTKKQCLDEILNKIEIEEWPIKEPSKVYTIENLTNTEDEDEEEEENNEELNVKQKKLHIEPRETKSVRLRIQMMRQKIALEAMKSHQEEEEEDERKLKRKIVSRRMEPSLRKMEISNLTTEDLFDKIRRKEKDNNERSVEPLLAAIRSAKNTQYMMEREMRNIRMMSERNARKHQKDAKIRRREEERLRMKGARKKKFLDMWKV